MSKIIFNINDNVSSYFFVFLYWLYKIFLFQKLFKNYLRFLLETIIFGVDIKLLKGKIIIIIIEENQTVYI